MLTLQNRDYLRQCHKKIGLGDNVTTLRANYYPPLKGTFLSYPSIFIIYNKSGVVFSLVSCEVLINRRCKYFLLITIVTQWFFCRNKTRAGEMWRTFGLWHFDLSLPGRSFWSASKSVYFFASSDPSVGRHCALIIVKKLLTVGESSGWWLCSGASHWRHHCHEPWWYDAEMERRQIKSYGIICTCI